MLRVWIYRSVRALAVAFRIRAPDRRPGSPVMQLPRFGLTNSNKRLPEWVVLDAAKAGILRGEFRCAPLGDGVEVRIWESFMHLLSRWFLSMVLLMAIPMPAAADMFTPSHMCRTNARVVQQPATVFGDPPYVESRPDRDNGNQRLTYLWFKTNCG